MYAVIKTGGKQYRVSEGDVIQIEKLDADVGAKIKFDRVLLMKPDNDEANIGSPHLEKCKVMGEVVEQTRGKKIEVLKFIRRKRHLNHRGHRQHHTVVRITQIA